MELLFLIILFVIIGSIFSLIGGILLLINKKFATKITHILSSFAAGSLLGAVFFDLLPEGIERAEGSIGTSVFLITVLFGIIIFYLLERFIHWQHHQHDMLEAEEPIVPLIVIGDSVHNFIDGVAIAAAFLINIPLGIVTAIAVGLHEIPQEIGDFGILLKKGLRRRKIILINFLSAITSIAGAVLAFYLGSVIENISVVFIAIAGGFFLYIALSNLIPEIHHENRRGFAFAESTALILGIIVTLIAIQSLRAFVS